MPTGIIVLRFKAVRHFVLVYHLKVQNTMKLVVLM